MRLRTPKQRRHEASVAEVEGRLRLAATSFLRELRGLDLEAGQPVHLRRTYGCPESLRHKLADSTSREAWRSKLMAGFTQASEFAVLDAWVTAGEPGAELVLAVRVCRQS